MSLNKSSSEQGVAHKEKTEDEPKSAPATHQPAAQSDKTPAKVGPTPKQ